MKYNRRKDKKFWKLARNYLHDYMPVIRNLSDKSVEAYKQSLKSYLKFLEECRSLVNENVTFEAFSRDNVKDFVGWLKEHNYAPKSINLKLTAIRSFLKYCSEEDFELRGIYTEVCSIKKQKEEKRPIQYLQPTAITSILSAYDTKTVKHLVVFIKEFHPESNKNPLLYSTFDGKPHRLSTNSISLVLKTAANNARKTCNDIPGNVHCHLIRKTKAMDLYKNGVPLPFIMQLLGHESMSTTSGFYAFATLEMMSDAMNKATPSLEKEDKLWKKYEIKKALFSLD